MVGEGIVISGTSCECLIQSRSYRCETRNSNMSPFVCLSFSLLSVRQGFAGSVTSSSPEVVKIAANQVYYHLEHSFFKRAHPYICIHRAHALTPQSNKHTLSRYMPEWTSVSRSNVAIQAFYVLLC